MTLWYAKNYTPTPRFPFESFLRDAEKILNDPFTQESASKYPLTNIGYACNTLIFEIALAGFKKENITVSYVGNVITVKAMWDSNKGCSCSTTSSSCSCNCCCDCKCDEIEYIQKNISTKDVCRKFYLSNEYLGGSIKWKYVDGLLTIAVYVNQADSSVEPSADDEELIPSCDCCNCNPGSGGSSSEGSSSEGTSTDDSGSSSEGSSSEGSSSEGSSSEGTSTSTDDSGSSSEGTSTSTDDSGTTNP